MRGNNQLRQECSEGSFGGVNLALTMPRAAQHLLRLAATQHYLGPSPPLSNLPVQLCCTGQSPTASGASRAAFGAPLWIYSPSPHLAAAAPPWRPQTGPRHAATRQTTKGTKGNSTAPLSNKNRRVDALAPAEGDNKAAD